jgi:cellulose synthase/poly-beta-1,6-N-acetylglucosamine synthase-like glycosyltransferase
MMATALEYALITLCTFMVVGAALPIFTGLFQFLLVGGSVFATHLERSAAFLPRVSVLIPAWNEGAVIGATIDRLMAMNYPPDRLRIYVVDDASSDETPRITIEKSREFPGNVFHLRRVAGGEGKAHTLNFGLETLWKSDWTEAVLIMDADVIYTEDSLVKMSRHLADPQIGAVTAYIKEGSASPNYVQRFVTFEYITATGASRRAQNALGFLACLSGGAQLHSRKNMMAIGGRIFSETLAEDTFTTFRTQLEGRKAIFEPNAIVYAEEPDSLVGLWKQRVRWGRGNVQITSVFRDLWFNRKEHRTMGSASMALMWFSIFLMPLFQIGASVGLITLYFVEARAAWVLFTLFWVISAIVYLVVTFASFAIDTESAKKSVVEGIVFPGVISLAISLNALFPFLLSPIAARLDLDPDGAPLMVITLLLYAWLSLAMLVSYTAKLLEESRHLSWLAPLTLWVGGYGAFLCAVTFGSYVKEILGAEMKWDKTVKTGKVS